MQISFNPVCKNTFTLAFSIDYSLMAGLINFDGMPRKFTDDRRTKHTTVSASIDILTHARVINVSCLVLL